MLVIQTVVIQKVLKATVSSLHRGPTIPSPARQEASRAATGPATGRDATAQNTYTTGQPSQSSQPAAQKASQPGAKLDEKLFTLGDSIKLPNMLHMLVVCHT